MSENDHPKLRNGLEALPFDHSGKRMVLLRDRIGFAPESLVFSPPVLSIIAKMDGDNSIQDLQAAFLKETGQLVYTEELRGLVDALDEHYFLDNSRFRTLAAREISAFIDSPVRKMYHAGKSYPENARELSDLLASFFAVENGGPGLPGPLRADSEKLVGLVAPHIDISAGGTSFAHAYKALAEVPHPETWIVLGTGHDFVENCFAVTTKDFETPLATIRCNAEICSELVSRAGRDIRASEYNHRIEHTIEFQAVFLSFIQPGARIVPVLCSFGQDDWESARDFIDNFACILGELVFGKKHSVGIIASVDLAHVGPRYGDRFTPNPGTVQNNLSSDASLLDMLEGCRADDFISGIHRDGNSRKICGVAPLYTMARALEGRASGKILCHDHATVDDNSSFVTFTSMAFYEKEGENGSGSRKS